jgi:hypothetical protein
MPSPRSAANPASHPPMPREHRSGLLPVAASRLVTGLSRASCRDATGLAVLMSTGRRAGLPGLSRPAAPAPPLARVVRITGPGRQIDIFSHRQLQRWGRLPGIANTGGWASQGTSHARGNGRLPGRWVRVTHRAAWSDALACSRGPRPTRQSGLQAMFLWRGREGSLGAGCSRIARGRRGGCLLVTSTPCPAGRGCITSTRPSCSRQRPGECATVGGLCAAEAQLRDPCSCRPTGRACSPPQASSWERCVTSKRRRCRPGSTSRRCTGSTRRRYECATAGGSALVSPAVSTARSPGRRCDQTLRQLPGAERDSAQHAAGVPPGPCIRQHGPRPGSAAPLRLPSRGGAPPMA